jgi:2-oxoglutarate ferredoxin oxidoreductase subunit alpha
MEPFSSEALLNALNGREKIILLEGNKTAQLGKLITLHTGITFPHVYLRYDGRPFNPGEIARKVMEVNH